MAMRVVCEIGAPTDVGSWASEMGREDVREGRSEMAARI